ncbi:hypothetical protein JQV19_19235 [Sulfitobacter mediterraneus]|uniref:hypothetical protein n=1 Tax=Sulfitobacter mediterraneus TaxID=83219 RepID=UPI00193A1E73|nr:hypothetical protein [Sulfitobacter mediterraneus]MBM1558390.1 hypothetical protein [Sulfitobacter mediterraneus]MBM1570332.1 hypothetical protein [Sulfitobacter mediterraneus]MBM1574145.1 hypothetical protein [Sulfitobacter mediterraneus]MBM1577941.1 hypothetical protein [Sulfitobacter mediterraneus]MBM1581378.1 hypothetical protein [Sulfitobacter mediterraneus]
MDDLKQGDVVVIRAAHDWPEHLFEVDETFDDCVSGYSITGPLAGVYGEPGWELIDRVAYRAVRSA